MAHLDISCLGTVQVTIARQPITRFRSANNQGVLLYLALRQEKPISREQLISLFWPDESEMNGRNNLRQALFQLRKLLGDDKASENPFLLVTRQTVQFNPDSEFQLDVDQFLQAIDSGDLETAVAHYHGDLLPGFTCDSLEFESWLRQEREHLHTLALETMVELTRDCLQDGRFEQAQRIAKKQLQLEPWREQAHRQLMRAFVSAGDRAKALHQFEQCQTVLMDELGVEPALETITLVEDIKAGRIGSIVADVPINPPLKVRHNLPAFSTDLIGRTLEIDEVGKRLTQEKQRLLSIVGPGGMGKTRLAVGVGATLLTQFQDGVYFVDLAPLNQHDEIPTAVAVTLNYQAPDKNQPLFPQLLAFLRMQKRLLILDNFEHLIDGAALVNTMLQSCPQLAILVTSRQRLGLVEENRFELGGLEVPDYLTPADALAYTAVQLFVENGRRVQSDFALTEENVTDVVRICQLVQGMPLGLLLAASWLELLSPAEIAAEVEKSLDFLAAELADLPSRQRSMEAVFDYSWQLLTVAEQAVLAKLSVFRGGFTREAAERVAGANLRQLLSLVSKSLLQRQVENGRFSIHELLRQFAARKRQLDKNDDTLFVHCTYFAEKIKRETQSSKGIHNVHIPSNYGADRDNLHRAWEYALQFRLADHLANLAPAIAMFSARQGKQASRVPREALDALQPNTEANSRHALLQLLLLEQTLRFGVDDFQLFREGMRALLPTFENDPHPDLLFWLYLWLAIFDPPTNNSWYKKAHDLAVEMQDEWLIIATEVVRVRYGLEEDGLNAALAVRLQDLLAYFKANLFPQERSNSQIFYHLLISLQRVHTALGAFEQAIQYGERCLTMAKGWQDLLWISNGFDDLAKTYLAMGRPDKAKLAYLESLEWHLAIGQVWQTLGLLYGVANLYPTFIGGTGTAVSIFSMVAHHAEVVTFHQRFIDKTMPQLKVELGAAEFAKAWEAGKQIDFETAVEMVKTTLESSTDELIE